MKPIKSQSDEDLQVIFMLNHKMYVLKEDEVSEIFPSEVELSKLSILSHGNRFVYYEVDESGYVCPWYIDISKEDLDALMEAVKSLEIEYKVGKFPDEKGRIHFFRMTNPNHKEEYEKCIKL